jgi:hypothetical protein
VGTPKQSASSPNTITQQPKAYICTDIIDIVQKHCLIHTLRCFLVAGQIEEVADFFFVDTTPFVLWYWKDLRRKYDWRGVAPRETYIANVVKVNVIAILLPESMLYHACLRVINPIIKKKYFTDHL